MEKKMWKFLLIFLLVSQHALGANILFVAIDPAPSHINTFKPIVAELLNRGHTITAIISNGFGIKSTNLTEIFVEPKIDLATNFARLKVFDKRPTDCVFGEKTISCFRYYTAELMSTCKHGRAVSNLALRCPKIQEFISENKEKFDMVIAELFAEEPIYAFAHKYKTPLVLISSFDYDFPTFVATGVHTIWSNIPQLQGTFDLANNFAQRLVDRVYTAFLVILRKALHINECNKIVQEVFEDFNPPSVKELEKNAALVMFNSLEILGKSKLREQGFINIAGVHIQPVQPIRKYIQKFLDEATNGVIYFSLGSIVPATSIPKKSLEMILEAFSKLNMKILWKFENSTISNFPKNIMTKSWLPQNDILAHKNVKLFITHGGVAGIQEGIYHQVPMLVIPIFGDQYQNAKKVDEAKIGKYLNFHDISANKLLSTIKSIVQNPQYYTNIQRISDEFRNGGVNPLANAIFWIEHVAKFKNVEHLKPRDYSVAWYEYFALDMICIFYILIKFILVILMKIASRLGIFRLFRNIWSLIRPNRKKVEEKDEKKKK